MNRTSLITTWTPCLTNLFFFLSRFSPLLSPSRFNFIKISVEGGHRAVIFDRFAGVKKAVVGEGTHFFIPWIQKPYIFDTRSRPRNIPVVTGSKGQFPYLFRPRE